MQETDGETLEPESHGEAEEQTNCTNQADEESTESTNTAGMEKGTPTNQTTYGNLIM